MAELENRVGALETKVATIETKVDAFIQEMRDFKTEMRDRDNQRATEIAELRQKHDADMKTLEAKTVESFNRLDSKLDKFLFQTQTLTIAAVAGIGAIAVSVIYSIFSR